MQKKIRPAIAAILLFTNLCHGIAEAGREIIAVQSIRVKPYEDAIMGFKGACHCRLESFAVSESGEAEIMNKISKTRPDMILAIGPQALSMVKNTQNIPVVYIMILNPRPMLHGKKNITGISMNIDQETQLDLISKVLPHVKNIGLLYNPDRTGYLVKKAQKSAKKTGIELVARKIRKPEKVIPAIKHMKGKTDAFWMVPDVTVITPETVEFLLLFSLENKIPVIAFSKKYTDSGALMSIGIDAFDIGSQAGEMAEKIFSGKNIKNIQQADARKPVLSINPKVAKKLGIHINDSIVKTAKLTD